MTKRPYALAALAFATLFAGSLSAGIVVTCPDTSYNPGPIAGLGPAYSCGETIATGPNSVDISVGPLGIFADATELEAWLGVAPGGFNQSFGPLEDVFAFGGSAIHFPLFTSNAGDTLSFSWTGSFEPEATGYLFYMLDGILNVLDHQVTIGNTTHIPTAQLISSQTVTQPLAMGNHSLALGVVVGIAGIQVLPCVIDGPCDFPVDELVLVDPTLNVTNLAVGSVPEPGTVALFGIGLMALVAFRRKRS